MYYNRNIRTWGAKVRTLSRVWVCGNCGTKVYCGRLEMLPLYRCLCGKQCWHKLNWSPVVIDAGD